MLRHNTDNCMFLQITNSSSRSVHFMWDFGTGKRLNPSPFVLEYPHLIEGHLVLASSKDVENELEMCLSVLATLQRQVPATFKKCTDEKSESHPLAMAMHVQHLSAKGRAECTTSDSEKWYNYGRQYVKCCSTLCTGLLHIPLEPFQAVKCNKQEWLDQTVSPMHCISLSGMASVEVGEATYTAS